MQKGEERSYLLFFGDGEILKQMYIYNPQVFFKISMIFSILNYFKIFGIL